MSAAQGGGAAAKVGGLQRSRPRLLIASFTPGAAGPQRDLADLMRAPVFRAAFVSTVWAVPDGYRGVLGKLRLARAAAAKQREVRAELIYLNLDLSLAFWLALIWRLSGRAPIVAHAKSAAYLSPRNPLLAAVYRWGLRKAASVRLAISEQAAQAMYGRFDAQTLLVPSAIDFAQLHAAAAPGEGLPVQRRGFTFACIGRLCAEKNQALAIDGLAGLRARGVSAELWLIGAGAARAALDAQVARLDLVDQVKFLGEVADPGALYRASIDVLLLPSLFEGQGRVVAEAQSFGIPVLASEAVPEAAFLDLSAAQCQRLPLDLARWIDAMAQRVAAAQPKRPPPAEVVANSALAIERGSALLVECLRAALRQGPRRG